MKRSFGIGLLSILLVLVIVLPACSTKTVTTTSTATTGTTSTTTSTTTSISPETIEIIFAHTTPAQAGNSRTAKAAADRIMERTNGRIKFTFYWSNSLFPQNEMYKSIQTGVADMAYFPIAQDFVPLSYGMTGLPFMNIPTMEVGTDIWWQLYNKYPAVQAEWTGIKIMQLCMMPPIQIHMTKSLVRTPADINGKKVIAGGFIAKVVQAAGAAPVEVGVQDLYMSLNSALTEGYINHWPVMNVFGVQPLLPYHANLGEGGIQMSPHSIIMNPASFDKLPPDIQEIFVEEWNRYNTEMLAMDNSEIQRCYKEADEAGHTTVYLTESEIEQWVALAQPIYEQWIKDMEAKGKTDARTILEEALSLIAAAQ